MPLALAASVLLILSAAASSAQGPGPVFRVPLAVGEELDYVVSYGPIHLGDLRLDAKAPSSPGQVRLTLSATSASGPLIPRIKATFDTLMDESTLQPLSFHNETGWGKDLKVMDYSFDRAASLIRYSGTHDDGKKTEPRSGEIRPADGVYDGVSLIVFIMEHCREPARLRPAFIADKEAVSVDIDATGSLVDVGPAADGAERKAWLVKGKMAGQGFAGLTGGFRVWLSADGSSIPLRAELKAWIGSITLSLRPAGADAAP